MLSLLLDLSDGDLIAFGKLFDELRGKEAANLLNTQLGVEYDLFLDLAVLAL